MFSKLRFKITSTRDSLTFVFPVISKQCTLINIQYGKEQLNLKGNNNIQDKIWLKLYPTCMHREIKFNDCSGNIKTLCFWLIGESCVVCKRYTLFGLGVVSEKNDGKFTWKAGKQRKNVLSQSLRKI